MNERHPFDPVSLIFGVLFVGISLPVLLIDTDLELDYRYVLPTIVILVGLLVLSTARRPRPTRPEDDH